MLNLLLSIIAAVLVILIFYFLKIKFPRKQNLSGKTAIVTGGSNGLGQQICINLAKKGCNIIIADISSADATMNKLKSFNIKSKAFKVDVSDYQEILKLKQNVLSDFGDVDIIINNAGLIPYKTILEQSSDEIELLTKVNLNSVMFMTKCFLDKMVEKGSGHIVSISSTQGIYAFPYSLSYSATKFAVTGFMLGLKEFLRRDHHDGINTTTILPNIISTRSDITDIINHKISEVLTPEKCAEITVEAIINKQSFVTIPKYYGLFISVFNILPFCIQHFIRDYLRREHLFFNSQKLK